MLSSFYTRDYDLNWMLTPSEQTDLNFRSTPIGTKNYNFNSPSLISTKDNYILFFYEKRNNNNSAIIGVDGNTANSTEVYAAISKNAQNFTVVSQLIGGSSSKSHGSPISFLNNNSDIVVLAISGSGFGGAGTTGDSLISKSVSVPNGAYRYWTDWEDLDTNIFEPLFKAGFDRFYTSPDSGVTLRNGTLACIIDYKNSTNSTRAEGFAILYSTDDGNTWKIGSRAAYTDHRFAKIIAERNDGKLLIAAVENSNNDYNKQANLVWFLADSLEGNISSFTVNGLKEHNCGSTAGGKITLSENGVSREAILLLHSYPNRETVNPNGVVNNVVNANALYVSFDNGQNWNMITNIFYPLSKGSGDFYVYDDYDNMSSFRQSMKIFKDGTIASVIENGGYTITGFNLVYRRFSLSAISDGKYKYEGL
ncbi:sialidase family protein [Brachyspira sp. SAP_772]|uniref:sialidase family protein n=1 Tax=Brachyspira sp. SAP_772 TaxID=2608385 RepID=UPI001E40002A|nr:sialidase family protein [Brachyspira sp. SAP_772]